MGKRKVAHFLAHPVDAITCFICDLSVTFCTLTLVILTFVMLLMMLLHHVFATELFV